MATPSSASRAKPLRQPFTVSHVVHRTSGLERSLHQVDRRDYRRGVEAQIGQGRFPGGRSVAGSLRPGPPSVMCGRGPSLRGKPSDANSCSLRCCSSSSAGSGATPPTTPAGRVWGNTPNPPSARVTGRAPVHARPQRRDQLAFALRLHVAQELERQVHLRGVTQRSATPCSEQPHAGGERRSHRLGEIERNEQPHARSASRPPRR